MSFVGLLLGLLQVAQDGDFTIFGGFEGGAGFLQLLRLFLQRIRCEFNGLLRWLGEAATFLLIAVVVADIEPGGDQPPLFEQPDRVLLLALLAVSCFVAVLA